VPAKLIFLCLDDFIYAINKVEVFVFPLNNEDDKMRITYCLLTVVLAAVLSACGEPRRTPDGHLMDRPKMSAYGPDDITRHETGNDENGDAENAD